ncbi:hypothetical protein ACE1SV_30970 [Streptomyces sp. E-15]
MSRPNTSLDARSYHQILTSFEWSFPEFDAQADAPQRDTRAGMHSYADMFNWARSQDFLTAGPHVDAHQWRRNR